MAGKKKKPFTQPAQERLNNLLRERTPGLTASAVAGNEGNRQISSGIVGDLFNVLARPSRAVAGAALGAVDKDPTTSPLEGLASGLSGRGQANFSDVLGALGVKNRAIKSIGGFGLDVALDPLTYLGIKGEKGVNASEAYVKAFARAKANDVSEDLLGGAVDRHVAQIMADDPAHLYVTFAGKKVGPSTVTPSKVYNVVKDAVVGPAEDRKGIAKLFSMTSELPDGLANKARVWESGSSAAFQDHQKAIGDLFRDLSPEQRQRVSFALDEGTSAGPEVPAHGVSHTGLNTLDDYQQLARGLMDKYFDDEVALGIRSAEQKVDNYVYKYFPGGLPDDYPGASKVAAARIYKQSGVEDLKKASLRTLANNPEVQPVTDIADMLQMRAAAHYRKVGRTEFVQDAIRTFGVEADKDNLGHLNKLGWMNADKHVLSDATKAFAEDNVYLPPHIVKALNATEKVLTDNATANQFMRFYDGVTRKWKFMNTVVNPGYWTRNSMSDAIMNFTDGVRNPKHYDQAFRIINEHRTNNTDTLLGEVLGAGNLAARKSSKIDFGGIRMDAERVWQDALRSGVKSGDITTNITSALDPTAKGGIGNMIDRAAANPFAKGEAKVASWNNMREDYFRLAHWLSATEEQVRRGVPYEDAIAKAGERVRKFNIDYGNMSQFERKYVRRAIPFYSWMRRNTPLQVELMLTRPGFMAAYSKGNDLMQGLLGTDDGSGDFMIPQWIRNTMPVRTALANNKSSNPIDKLIRLASGAKGDEAVFMPAVGSMTPLGDLQHLTEPIQAIVDAGGLTHPGAALTAGTQAVARDVVNMSTPFVKAPVELATKRSTYTGAPITNWQDWLVGQVSPGRLGQNVGSGQNRGLTSSLLGVQLQPAGDQRQKSEYMRRAKVLESRIRNTDNKSKQKRWESYLKRTRRAVGA